MGSPQNPQKHVVSGLSVVSVADRAGFHTFASALRASDHLAKLESGAAFTVFAPSDEAFRKFSTAALDRLLHDDRELLNAVLGYHFAVGKVATARFASKRIRAVMYAGGDVIIDGRSGLKVNNARIVKPDLSAANGVIHGIDAVLWPREAAATIAAP